MAALWVLMSGDSDTNLVISQNRGTPIRTPKMVPLILGNPHFLNRKLLLKALVLTLCFQYRSYHCLAWHSKLASRSRQAPPVLHHGTAVNREAQSRLKPESSILTLSFVVTRLITMD